MTGLCRNARGWQSDYSRCTGWCGRIRKTASDIHAPVSGTVVEINSALEDDPDFINEDPYGKGWIYKIRPDNMQDVDTLLSNTAYEAGL